MICLCSLFARVKSSRIYECLRFVVILNVDICVVCSNISQNVSVVSDFCQESGLEMSTENYKAGDDFIVALFNLFSCLNNIPKALTQALQPYLERAHIWEHLYTLAGKVANSCSRRVLHIKPKHFYICCYPPLSNILYISKQKASKFSSKLCV